MNNVAGTLKQMYKSKEYYEVVVNDNLDPMATTFTVGVNGRISSHPTKEVVKLLGSEVKALMNARIPQEKYEMTRGYRKITGIVFTNRFSISPVGFGPLPSGRAAVIVPDAPTIGKAKHIMSDWDAKKPESELIVDESMEEPLPESYDDGLDRQSELEVMTRNELLPIAASLGISGVAKMTKAALINAVIAVENGAAYEEPGAGYEAEEE